MIRQNLYLLIKNAKYWMAVFLLLFFTGILLIYQEKNEILTGIYKARAIDWAMEQEKPAKAAEKAAMQRIAFVSGEDTVQFTETAYYDYVLLLDAASYLERQQEYGEKIDYILTNLQAVTASSLATAEMRVKNMAAYEQYAALKNVRAAQGNFLAWEKFCSLGMPDVTVLLAIFCSVYFLVIQEREKGMEHLMFASKNGGMWYFVIKASAVFAASVLLMVMFLVLKLGVYARLYGLGDMGAAVQSMEGYSSCPYALCIWQYALLFVIWKLIAAGLTGVLMLVVCSLPLSEAGCGLMLAAITLGSILFDQGIDASSSWLLLRDAGLLSLWDVEYWFTAFRCYVLGNTENVYWILSGTALPLNALAIYALSITGAGLLLYYRGIRKSGRKKRQWGKLWQYRGGCAGNEILFLGLQKHCFVLLAALILLPVYLVMDFSENMNAEIRYERQCVEMLNEQSFPEAVQWLEAKEEEFDEMEQQLVLLEEQYACGEITETAYEQLIGLIMNQLTMRPLINAFVQQAEEMEPLRQQGVEVQFEYTALSGQIVGEAGRDTRLMLAIFIGTFLTFSVLTIFPADRQLGMHRLIGSESWGGRSMTARLLWLIASVFFVSVTLHGIWLYSLWRQYRFVGWDSLLQSWSFYRESAFHMTVGNVIIAEVVWQGVKWAALAGVGLYISMKTANTVWVQILGIVLYLGPPAIGLTGAEWIEQLPYYPLLQFSGQSLARSWLGSLLVAGLLVVSMVLMERGKCRWMENSSH